MVTQRDYYEVLGVARDADSKAIKDAFRDLALKYHPDRNKEASAEERFKDIVEAYAILSDQKKRADYDAQGFAGVEGVDHDDLFGDINFEDIFSGINFDFGGGKLFENIFRRRKPVPARGLPIELDVMVSLDRIASGGEEKIYLKRPVTCPHCHGTGEAGGAEPPPCIACHGTGQVLQKRRESKEHILIQHITACTACDGRGVKLANPCQACQGTGKVETEECLSVKVPVGAEEGLALRIQGKGMPSSDVSGIPGDLFVVIRTRPDPRFSRVGSDLLHYATIKVEEAVLGTSLTVPTIKGSVRVLVPAGTQPDAVLRLKGQGLPAFGEGPNGDMLVHIKVHIPEEMSATERDLYEKLRSLGAGAKP